MPGMEKSCWRLRRCRYGRTLVQHPAADHPKVKESGRPLVKKSYESDDSEGLRQLQSTASPNAQIQTKSPTNRRRISDESRMDRRRIEDRSQKTFRIG